MRGSVPMDRARWSTAGQTTRSCPRSACLTRGTADRRRRRTGPRPRPARAGGCRIPMTAPGIVPRRTRCVVRSGRSRPPCAPPVLSRPARVGRCAGRGRAFSLPCATSRIATDVHRRPASGRGPASAIRARRRCASASDPFRRRCAPRGSGPTPYFLASRRVSVAAGTGTPSSRRFVRMPSNEAGRPPTLLGSGPPRITRARGRSNASSARGGPRWLLRDSPRTGRGRTPGRAAGPSAGNPGACRDCRDDEEAKAHGRVRALPPVCRLPSGPGPGCHGRANPADRRACITRDRLDDTFPRRIRK